MQLHQKQQQFAEAGLQVVLVGLGSKRESEVFLEQYGLTFPLVCDPDRRLYEAYGLGRMGPLGFLSPTLALRGLSAMSRGHLMGLPAGDVRQLSGVFVIDGLGRVRYRYVSRDPSDVPEPEEILKAAAGI